MHHENFTNRPTAETLAEIREKLAAFEQELKAVRDNRTPCQVPRHLHDVLLIVPPAVYKDYLMVRKEQFDSILAHFHMPIDVIMPPIERRHA